MTRARDVANIDGILTTTGDTFYASSGGTPARLGIGSTDQVLKVSGGVPTWATPTAASGPAFRAYASTTQSVSANTFTKITFGAEDFDTDSCFASSNFTPTKSGYYQINTTINQTGAGGGGSDYFYFYKNGAEYLVYRSQVAGSGSHQLGDLIYLNGTTDYVSVYWYGSAITVQSSTTNSTFSGVWIRS